MYSQLRVNFVTSICFVLTVTLFLPALAAAQTEEELEPDPSATVEPETPEEAAVAGGETEDTAAGKPSEEVDAADEAEEERDEYGAIEELFVTAERRETKLQETPIAISVLTQEFMEQQVVNDARDYTLLIPSFSYRDNPNRVVIRGIGQILGGIGMDPGVAIYLDGVYTSVPAFLNLSSFSIERVEVLRGPQGTLYGRNVTGGAVNMIFEKPSDEFHAETRVLVGNLDHQEYGIKVKGPIGGSFENRVRYHLLFNRTTRDGYIHNQSGKDLGSLEGYYGTAQLEADPTDDLNVWLAYSYWTLDGDGGNVGGSVGVLDDPYMTTRPDPLPKLLALNPQWGWPVPNPTVGDLHAVDHNNVSSLKSDGWMLRSRVTWDIGPVTLKYLGGYSDIDVESNGADLDRTSNPSSSILEDGALKKKYTSSELQLLSNNDGDFQWLAGLFYYHEDVEEPYSTYGPQNARMEIFPFSDSTNPKRRYYFQKSKLKTNSYAVFGGASYDFLDDWSVTAGLRYSYDEKDGKEFQQRYADARALLDDPDLNFALDLTDPDNDRHHKEHWSSVSGRFVLQYMPIEEVMLYALFSSGYRPGGINLGGLLDDPVVDNATVYAYEIGAKTTLLDNHLQLNGTFFYYDYRDLQVARAVFDPAVPATITEVMNAAEASVFGIELEGLYRYDFELLFLSNITLSLGYSWLHARYDDFCCSVNRAMIPLENGFRPSLDLSGNPLMQSPDHKVSTSLRYGIFTRVGEFAVTGRFSWVDDQLYSIFDDHRRWGSDYHRTDLFASWTATDIPVLQDVTIIGFVKNLEDDQNVDHVQVSGAIDLARRYVYPNLPRTYGLEFHLSY